MNSENHPKKKKLDQKLVMFLFMRPMSTVEGRFFKEFIKEFNPTYVSHVA